MRLKLIGILISALLSATLGCKPSAKSTAVTGPQPNAALSPADVVNIQMNALQANDASDRGIEITFRFASPANKQMTGPLDRFAEMVKQPPYGRMLNFRDMTIADQRSDGDVAEQVVVLTDAQGEKAYYVFRLSKQSGGELDGCWMTDGVMPIEPMGEFPATQPAAPGTQPAPATQPGLEPGPQPIPV